MQVSSRHHMFLNKHSYGQSSTRCLLDTYLLQTVDFLYEISSISAQPFNYAGKNVNVWSTLQSSEEYWYVSRLVLN